MKVLITLFLVCLGYGGSTGHEEKDWLLTKTNYKRVRCTRRYTPGSCLESVRPMWTYVPHLQTCAERLGCPADYVANRFGSLEQCQDVCRQLIFLYMYLQQVENTSTFMVPVSSKSEDSLESDAEYQHNEKTDSSSDEHETREPNIDTDFRRHELSELLSKLSKVDSDYEEVGDQDGGNDERPPIPSSREVLQDDRDLVLPDIDNF